MRALVIAVVLAIPALARAYPQFQISKDVTCSACHLSPAGGGLLSENGLMVAEGISQWGTAPEVMYDKLPLPSWLALGGDFRGAAGYDGDAHDHQIDVFPMQADLYAAATAGALSLHVTGGLQDPQYGNTLPTLFGSREHWLQWQQDPGSPNGLFVRAGRFLPVFGLRFVEHPDYDRRFGGLPLYGEAYGLAVEYIDPRWEVHATGFVHDPLQIDDEHGNGAAVYAEARVTSATAIGVEGKYDRTRDDRELYGGVTAKQYLAGPQVLVEAELEVVHQKIALGGTTNQLVGTVLGSYFVGAFELDLGLDAYDPNVRYAYLDREAVDVDVHWFATSHVELVATNRFQMLEFGAGGLSSGYSLLQLHYRL